MSAIVLAKNEEKSIERCLRSLHWCDEIIVVDDNSEDKTVSIAKLYGAKIFKRNLANNFAGQRNFGLEKAKGEWVLFIDADEVVSKDLQQEILSAIEKEHVPRGYFITRADTLWGKQMRYGEWGDQRLIRLAGRNAGKWKGVVHERWEIVGQLGELQSPLFHYPHQSVEAFIKEVNFYTDLRAKELFEQGGQVTLFEIIFYPKLKFLVNYFFKLGILDGMQGLIIALIMSFHSFLVRAKLWELWQKKK